MNNLNAHSLPGNNHWPDILLVVILALLLSSFAQGQSFPSGFAQTQIANGISDPTAMAFEPVNNGRIFVTEQEGALRVIKNGSLLLAPALELAVNSEGERGLVGVALDPDFVNNHYVYLYYTVPDPLHNRISRFTLNGDLVIENSEVVVLDLDPLGSATNHNGGAMAFGPDGLLYVGVGDNADGDNSQDLDTYHGKLLRINSDGSVPAGNPFTTGSAQQQRIWAYGLRNPYTIAVNHATEQVFVNDVGLNDWEEINDATGSGHNFGWPDAEGNSTNTDFTNPVFAYALGDGDDGPCAITGGTFFADSSFLPAQYRGKYFFIDLCDRWIQYIDPTASSPTQSAFATNLEGGPIYLKTGRDGNLYYLSREVGALYKIGYTNVTAVKANQTGTGTVIYPQPAVEFVYIETNTPMDNYTVSITGPLGNAVNVPFNLEGEKLLVNISALPSGMYALRLQNSTTTTTQQISVVH